MIWTCAEEGYGYIGQRMLRLAVPGKRRRGRLTRKFIDVVREDMRAIGVTVGCKRWGEMEIYVLLWQPLMGTAKKKKEEEDSLEN